MKKLILILLLGGLSAPLAAQTLLQTTFNSGGDYVSIPVDTVRVSYSIGEALIGVFPANGNAGFQQPWFVNLSQTAVTDSVWPGDANDDGVANNVDLLAIGLGYNSMGPGRPNASLTWVAQPALPWVQTLPIANYKHLDCDGNSLIEAADTLAIQQNYGLTHPQKTQKSTGTPLMLTWVDDAPEVGDTLEGSILFGVDTMPLTDAYGLAWGLEIDTSLFSLASLRIDYSDSWLGDVGNDALSLTRILPDESRADLAQTRIDQTPVAGFGRVASLTIIMIDDLAGKQDSQLVPMRLVDAVAVNAAGQLLAVEATSDPLFVNTETTHLPDLPPGLSLYPNPATDLARLTVPAGWTGTYFLRDVEGRQVGSGALEGENVRIPLSDVAVGMYFLEVQTPAQRHTLPLQVQH